MKEFRYDDAVIRITIPNEEQLDNIRKATEVFLKKAIKEGIFQNELASSGAIDKK